VRWAASGGRWAAGSKRRAAVRRAAVRRAVGNEQQAASGGQRAASGGRRAAGSGAAGSGAAGSKRRAAVRWAAGGERWAAERIVGSCRVADSHSGTAGSVASVMRAISDASGNPGPVNRIRLYRHIDAVVRSAIPPGEHGNAGAVRLRAPSPQRARSPGTPMTRSQFGRLAQDDRAVECNRFSRSYRSIQTRALTEIGGSLA
jgi:hypothetical protein